MFILDYFGLKREAFDSVANFSALSFLLTARIFPVWDLVVEIFARRAMVNMRWIHSIPSFQYLYCK